MIEQKYHHLHEWHIPNKIRRLVIRFVTNILPVVSKIQRRTLTVKKGLGQNACDNTVCVLLSQDIPIILDSKLRLCPKWYVHGIPQILLVYFFFTKKNLPNFVRDKVLVGQTFVLYVSFRIGAYRIPKLYTRFSSASFDSFGFFRIQLLVRIYLKYRPILNILRSVTITR